MRPIEMRKTYGLQYRRRGFIAEENVPASGEGNGSGWSGVRGSEDGGVRRMPGEQQKAYKQDAYGDT